MRLKTLEIKGFKSFANDTAIHFSGDVIGVVGPNGCGKSNVVDAIRWVLGEQKSSQLRLDKMTSIIFSGTKKRKEAQMAQVSLTFENTKNVLPVDYQSVTVSRILYRSGDSEYRLNGVRCRLKDIRRLSSGMRTHVGRDQPMATAGLHELITELKAALGQKPISCHPYSVPDHLYDSCRSGWTERSKI